MSKLLTGKYINILPAKKANSCVPAANENADSMKKAFTPNSLETTTE
jgi:hypothetical protein